MRNSRPAGAIRTPRLVAGLRRGVEARNQINKDCLSRMSGAPRAKSGSSASGADSASGGNSGKSETGVVATKEANATAARCESEAAVDAASFSTASFCRSQHPARANLAVDEAGDDDIAFLQQHSLRAIESMRQRNNEASPAK